MSNQKTEVMSKTQTELSSKEIIENYYEKKEILIKQISFLHNYIDPYTMEYIRFNCKPLVDILVEIKNNLDELINIGLKCKDKNETTNEVHFRDENCTTMDIRSISSIIGSEPYGRTFRFLEKMNERFINHPQFLFLDKLKYMTDNSCTKLEKHLLNNIEELTTKNNN